MKKIRNLCLNILLFLLLSLSLASCSHRKNVTIVIKNPLLSMNCVTDSEITESQQFLKKAWDAFAAQYKKYNAHANFILFEQTDYDSNIPDCYGTPYAADILYAGYFNMSTYIHQGHVVPLDSIITDKIRDDFDDSMWAVSKASNGKTYMLPFTNLQNILAYNKDLFRKCGLEKYISDKEEIQGWTLDEWDEILAALREKLPPTSYPMMMYAKNNQGDTHTMLILRSKGCNFFDLNGRINLTTPQGILALQWIKDNYDKGYYPFGCDHLEILDNGDLFYSNQLALYVYNTALASQMGANKELGFVNFPSVSKQGIASTFVTGFMAFDNDDNKRLEVAKDFLKFIYSTPEWLDYSAGGIPCSKGTSLRQGDKIPVGQMFIDNNKNVVDYQNNSPNWLGVRAAFYPHIQELLKGTLDAAHTALAIDRDCNKAIEDGYGNSKLHD